MITRIRLMRFGRIHKKYYRIVAIGSQSKREGKFIESIGFVDGGKNGKLEINKDSLNSWLKKGAQPSEAVRKLLQL